MSNSNSPYQDLVSAFAGMSALPRAVWLIIAAYVIDSMAYFGMLTLMSEYLSSNVGWGDTRAGWGVSLFTMSVTLFMLGAGSIAEGFGLRRAVLFGLLICLLGRIAYCFAPGMTGLAVAGLVVGALVVTALGEAILQPVTYSGVKQYTNAESSPMGYAMIYAFMNLGIVVVGALSAWIRPAVQAVKDAPAAAPVEAGGLIQWLADRTGSGIQAVNWVCTGLAALALVGFYFAFPRGGTAGLLRPDATDAAAEARPLGERLRSYFTEGPFTNARFIFFIFMLMPVRTLFAHQWLTFPQYILRAYDTSVSDRMEWLINWINPLIIFFGVPLAAALTRRVHIYKLMIIGSLVSAVPTFLLCAGPNLTLLITYFVIFSIGEALWTSRFLEYASELAPPGRVAQYMGLANVPWLLAKGTTGIYSGYLLSQLVPDKVPPAELQSAKLWFIYGCIAMLSPIGLWLARGWVLRGFTSGPGQTPGQAAPGA